MTVRERRFATPRPVHMLIGSVLMAILVPAAVTLIERIVTGKVGAGRSGADLIGDIGLVALYLGGPGVIIGWPIAALVRLRMRHSILVNLAAFTLFVVLAPAYQVYQSYQVDQFPNVGMWVALALVFAAYGALCVGVALLIGRIRPSSPSSDPGLTDIFQ